MNTQEYEENDADTRRMKDLYDSPNKKLESLTNDEEGKSLDDINLGDTQLTQSNIEADKGSVKRPEDFTKPEPVDVKDRIKLQSKLQSQDSRLTLYISHPKLSLSVWVLHCAQAGFIPHPYAEGYLYCPWCDLCLNVPRCKEKKKCCVNFVSLHRKYSKNCRFMREKLEDNMLQEQQDHTNIGHNGSITLSNTKEGPTIHSGLRGSIPQTHLTLIQSQAPKPSPDKQLAYEDCRRKSFPADSKYAEDLAKNGFYYNTGDGVAVCFCCKSTILEWQEIKDVMKKHRDISPNCSFITGDVTVQNVPEVSNLYMSPSSPSDESKQLGIFSEARYPNFAVESRRVDTFLTADLKISSKAEEFYKKGLFFTGRGSTLCCYECGVEMENMAEEEDIWCRHAQQSPDCQLLIREKGQGYIDDIITEYGPYSEGIRMPAIRAISNRMVRPRYDCEVAQKARALGYTAKEVVDAIKERVTYNLPDFESVKDLVAAIIKVRGSHTASTSNTTACQCCEIKPVYEPAGDVDEILISEQKEAKLTQASEQKLIEAPMMSTLNYTEQANSLKAKLLCKICMDAPVSILFMPCAHLIACGTCSSAMVECPICRDSIKGRVLVEYSPLLQPV